MIRRPKRALDPRGLVPETLRNFHILRTRAKLREHVGTKVALMSFLINRTEKLNEFPANSHAKSAYSQTSVARIKK